MPEPFGRPTGDRLAPDQRGMMHRRLAGPAALTVALTVALALALAGCQATGGSLAATSAVPSEPTLSPASPTGDLAGPATASPTDSAGAPLGPSAPTGPTESAAVVRVVDGDTIVVDRGHGQEKVRYIGVDTPETVDPSRPVAWMGPEASAANERLVEGRSVVLEKDVSEVDRYGRLLRYVWLPDGTTWTLVNLELVREGYAQVSTYPPDVKYVDAYLAAQAVAREAGLGLWGPSPGPDGSDGSTSGAGSTSAACDPAYPTVCIPPPPPDLDCADIPYRRFRVLPPDPHRFDGDHDGIGCESG